ncbi:MAG: zinc ribbon domain-containing protein [Anaerolineales bacterium]|nr:zinc ribbon domain-containing protein [Anaerolineales bacterium]
MERRIYHGNLAPSDLAQALMAAFNQGNLRTQLLGESDNLTVQIASSQMARSGGKTALAINIQRVKDGVMVQVGEQEWLGVAASLGATALSTLLNPFNLIGRLDDLAQDITNLQLRDKVWEIIAHTIRAAGASHQLSERLRRMICEYCATANEVGQSSCVACGAPLGKVQPKTCGNCGFVIKHGESICPNCGKRL